MKNDLAYWEKNKEHLQKHFLDWEEFVWAEKIDKKELIFVALEPFIFVLALVPFFLIGWFLFWPFLFTALIPLFVFYIHGKRIAQGTLLPHWLILTNRAIYYCCGKECQIVYQWSFSDIYGIFPFQSGRKRRKSVTIISNEPRIPILASPQKAPLFTFLNNQIKIAQGYPGVCSMHSLSAYDGSIRVHGKGNGIPNSICLTFDPDTEIFAPLEGILHAYPDILYKRRREFFTDDLKRDMQNSPIKQEWRMFERDEKE